MPLGRPLRTGAMHRPVSGTAGWARWLRSLRANGTKAFVLRGRPGVVACRRVTGGGAHHVPGAVVDSGHGHAPLGVAGVGDLAVVDVHGHVVDLPEAEPLLDQKTRSPTCRLARETYWLAAAYWALEFRGSSASGLRAFATASAVNRDLHGIFEHQPFSRTGRAAYGRMRGGPVAAGSSPRSDRRRSKP